MEERKDYDKKIAQADYMLHFFGNKNKELEDPEGQWIDREIQLWRNYKKSVVSELFWVFEHCDTCQDCNWWCNPS